MYGDRGSVGSLYFQVCSEQKKSLKQLSLLKKRKVKHLRQSPFTPHASCTTSTNERIRCYPTEIMSTNLKVIKMEVRSQPLKPSIFLFEWYLIRLSSRLPTGLVYNDFFHNILPDTNP